ncbi:MAG: hypothetical protein H7338_15100, partial [Candidatus Sericytochromatia bacterium]|nr:hypothetical protein [Candidatus Sericytochromatia bacterium]
MRRLLTACLVFALITACQPGPMTVSSGQPPAGQATTDTRPVLISGRVMGPGFAIKATTGDVTGNAGVALLDRTTNATFAGGVTDAAGNFTLYQSAPPFVPVVGTFYVLEASKRLSTGAFVTLRTMVERKVSSWNSVTGATVIINPTTSALVKLGVLPAALMSTVSGANFDVVAAITGKTIEQVGGKVAESTAVLLAGQDPGGAKPTTFAGNYTITDAASLANCRGYTTIAGSLTVAAPGLASVSLPNLKTISSNLTVDNQASLTQLSLPSLQSVGTLSLQGNPQLSTFGLFSLVTVGGNVTINNNAALTSVVGLSGLTTVGISVIITNNAALTSLKGLSALATLGLTLDISNNAALTSLAGWSGPTTIGLNLIINNNAALTSLAGAAGSITTGLSVAITNNAALTSLAGLSRLTAVGLNLTVSGNGALTSLAGLSGPTTLGGTLAITNNAALTSLAGLSG